MTGEAIKSVESFDCIVGSSAQRPVLLGFASAKLLHALSFADVLNEDTGRGYQRRFHSAHSLDFRRYIRGESSSTIPLTFNLRPNASNGWRVIEGAGRNVVLEIERGTERFLAQVDCQHRLGHLADLDIELPFMCFQGLTELEETEIFGVINGKAKGLSRSLLDFHDAQLCNDLATDRPELFIALYLKNEPASPWHMQLDLGGGSTSGLHRRASLRTIQKAIKRFLNHSHITRSVSVEESAKIVLDFWRAVASVLNEPWSRPRKFLINKGVGVYALMDLASDLVVEALPERRPDYAYFAQALSDFAIDFDWSSDGPLRGLGGESGVASAVEIIREARRRSRLRVVNG